MGDWKEYRLGDILSIKSGFSYQGKYIGTGDSLLLGMGCVSFKERFLMSGARPYSGPFDDRYKVLPGDIVLATRQQSDNLPILAMPAMVPNSLKGKDVVIGTNLYKVEITDNTFSNEYIFWLLKTKQYVNYIAGVKTGTTVSMVTKKNVEDFTFFAPTDQSEREKIISIISILDKSIDNNRAICSNLEEFALAIYKNWFIDFAPFSDGKFVDSEFGMIPEGWSILPIDEVFNIKYGKNLPTSKIEDKGDYPVYGANGIMGYYSLYNYDSYVTLITSRGSGSGDVSRTFQEKTFVTNNSFAVKPQDNYSYMGYGYTYYCMKNINFKPYCSGSAQPQLTNSSISAISILVPDYDVIIKFNSIASYIHREINRAQIESDRLTTLRDSLLQKLMSGQIKP